VLRAIARSPHAAAPVAELEKELGGARGTAALACMNELNLLVRRSYEPLARDIDVAAFGPALQDVYTLLTPAHALAARRKLY
jgi:hypothetical protein